MSVKPLQATARRRAAVCGTFGENTTLVSWGFATEGVCVRGGPRVAKADNE